MNPFRPSAHSREPGFIVMPILVPASLLLGIFAVVVTSREEEPRIVVPMMDVMVAHPGATAAEVEVRVTKPMERKLLEIEGVGYVHSITRPGMSLLLTAGGKCGEYNMERQWQPFQGALNGVCGRTRS